MTSSLDPRHQQFIATVLAWHKPVKLTDSIAMHGYEWWCRACGCWAAECRYRQLAIRVGLYAQPTGAER